MTNPIDYFYRKCPCSYFAQMPAENNFQLLRFVAACLVIYTHCYGLTGRLPDPQRDYFAQLLYLLGNVGVDMFFIISGFLITKSYLTRDNFWIFVRARMLRLYPGLFVSLLVVCLMIGPFNTTIPLAEYFQGEQLKTYFFYNLSLIKTVLSLPGVFMNTVYVGNVNGSLWTLPAEVRMYLLIAFFGLARVLSHRRLYTAVIALCALGYWVDKDALPLISDNPLYYKLSWFFFVGSLFYVYRDIIPQSKGLCIALGVLMLLASQLPELYRHPVYGVTLPYITLWLAFNVPCLNIFNKVGDYSYGIYIYAFPIQQSLVSLFPEINVVLLFYISLLLTLVFAIPSWHLIEKPALRYKTFGKQ